MCPLCETVYRFDHESRVRVYGIQTTHGNNKWHASFYLLPAPKFNLWNERDIGKNIIQFDFLPDDITPFNFHEKIKTLLTFL